MLAKGHITQKGGPKELNHLSSSSPTKERTISIPLYLPTQNLKHRETK
jgi:hypothetical protein